MDKYPPLKLATESQSSEEISALAEAEAIRAWIAQNHGLEALASVDQCAKAMAELGVAGVEQATAVHSQIGVALVEFQFRGFPIGQSPTPRDIQDALSDIADGALGIARGLALLRTARMGVGLNNNRRVVALENVHRRVIQVIVENALPQSLSAVTPDKLDATTPTATHLSFNDDWTHRWEHIAALLAQVANADNATELRNPSRRKDEAFVNFVHRLGAIYRSVTGKDPRADVRKSTQPDDWHSPFVRFVHEVWPLTPEGSHGIVLCPDNIIARALKTTPSF